MPAFEGPGSPPSRSSAGDLINAGRSIARFTRHHDPSSLRFVAGFEPDFSRGGLEAADSSSRLYGGKLRRYRIVSRNRRVQYLFMAAPKQVWIGALQATTTELSSYGVRTVDVIAPDDLLIPAFEYHYMDGDVLVSQIPKDYIGATS